MKVKATLRRVADGVVRSYAYEVTGSGAEDEAAVRFLWEDGNWACDCNRELLFARAGGDPDPAEGTCGSSAFELDELEIT